MPIYEIRTFKHSDVWGINLVWDNRYFFDTPFTLAEFDMDRFVTQLCYKEAEFCHIHVRFDRVAVQLAGQRNTTSESIARGNIPMSGNIRGAWGNPPVVASYFWRKNVTKYLTHGKPSRWWFSGGLATVDITQDAKGNVTTVYRDFWNGIIQSWLPYWQNNFGATLLSPLGARGGAAVQEWARVLSLDFDHVTLANGLKRKQFEVQYTGDIVKESIDASSKILELGRWQILQWYEFNGNLVPCSEAKALFTTVMGEVKTSLLKAQNYANGQDGAGNQTHVALFRWPPGADAIDRMVSPLIDKIEKDIEQVNALPCYVGPSGSDAMMHDIVIEINDRMLKYSAALASLSFADWQNPDV